MTSGYKRGSKDIDDYIIEHYPSTNAKVIADKFGLKENYVTHRAYKLGVNRVKGKKTAKDVEYKPRKKAIEVPAITIKGNRLIHRCI